MKSLRDRPAWPQPLCATAALVVALPAVVSNRALDDWPQWRGPNRDGRSAETGLLKAWPAGGPPLAWRATGAGEGYSSFAASQGRLFTLGARGDTEYVIAFDAASGKRLWETAHGTPLQQRPRRRSARDADHRRRSRLRVRRERRSERARRGDRQGRTGPSTCSSSIRGSNIQWGLSESPLVLERSHPASMPAGRSSRSRRPTAAPIWTDVAATRPGYSSAVPAEVRQRQRRRSSSRAARPRRRRQHAAGSCGATARSRTTSRTSRRRSCAATACSSRRTTAPDRRCSS